MAVVIRLKRTGRKNRPSYRICATDRRVARDGRMLETLGNYDPASPKPELRVAVDLERAKHWLEHGAKPSDTVASILRRQGLAIPHPKPRKPRKGRSKKTAAKTRRAERKQALLERKSGRLAERKAARKKAKAAAPAEAQAPA